MNSTSSSPRLLAGYSLRKVIRRLIAPVFVTALSFATVLPGRADVWLNETFDSYATSATPDSTTSPLVVSATATTVIEGNGGKMARYSKPLTTSPAGNLQFRLSTASSTARPRGYISFKILRNTDAGIATGNFFSFRLGTNDATALSADAASIISIRFYQTSSTTNFRVYSAGVQVGTSTTYNPTDVLKTIRVWYNDDDAAALDYVDPSGSTQTLATNSFIVYLGNTLITPSASGSALANSTGASLNIGKLAFNVSSTSAADMSLDDIYAADSAPSAAAPAITSATVAQAYAGVPFSFQIVADGATSFTAAPLPDGLTLNPTTGLISGTPTTLGDTVVSVTATGPGGTSAPIDLTITVAAPTANVFSGTNPSLNIAASWSLGQTPNSAANLLGSFQDLELEPAVADLTTASTFIYAKSWNVTNGSAYTVGSTAATTTSFRFGNTGTTDTSPFNNTVSATANDLVYLTGNSSLTFLTTNPTGGSTPSTIELRNSGNLHIDAGSTLTLLPVVSGSGKVLTKTGSGTAILGAANTYSGGTVAAAGTLTLDDPLALGTGALTLAGGTVSSNVNASLNFSTSASLAVVINAASTVDVAADKTVTVGRVISTASSADHVVTKTGPGTLQLTGPGTASTVIGGYKVNAGTLYYNTGANGGAGVGPLVLDGGNAFFSKGPSSTFTYGGFALFGLTVLQNATLTLDPNPLTPSGANTLSFTSLTAGSRTLQIVKGPTALSSADTVGYTDPSVTFSSATLTGDLTLDVAANTAAGLQAAAGTGSVTKTGPGRLSLATNATTLVANTYSGPTTISAGTLALSGNHASALSLASGTVLEFTLNDGLTPIATSSNTVALAAGSTVSIVGTPAAATTYPLLTASFISGTPVLAAPVEGFELAVTDSTTLVLRPVAISGDFIAPVITLNGSASVSVDWGSSYTDAGATATDNVDSSVNVITSGLVNTSKPDVYTLTYNASDAANNAATPVTRTVTVSIAGATTVGADGYSPLMRYAFGALSPTDTIQLPLTSSTATTLSITAVVRTDDTALAVVGETNTDLIASGSWTSTGVTVTDAADQGNKPAGCMRKVFTVDTTGAAKKFLRLKVVATF